MDIQKEREAFEKALVNQKNISINNLHVCTIFDAEKNKYSPSDVCDPKEDFIVDWINSSWSIWQAAKAQAVPETKKFNLDEFLLMEQKLKSKGGIIKADLDRFIAYAEMVLEKAKAKAVPDTYTPIVLALEDVQSKIEKTSFLTMDADNESEVYAVDANEISAYIDELIEAQEPK